MRGKKAIVNRGGVGGGGGGIKGPNLICLVDWSYQMRKGVIYSKLTEHFQRVSVK